MIDNQSEMKKFLLILMIILPAAQFGRAQRCEQTDLSKRYVYQISVDKSKDADGDLRVSKINLRIVSKSNKTLIQKITVKSDLLFETAYSDCSAARSFVTGKNKNAEASDNDYGDFVVADFNFDGKEDFAVKRDSGGNGGAFYDYYTQNNPGKFEKDAFLTDEMIYFPGTFNTRKKRLITYVHANAQGFNENVFQYNAVKKKWKYVSQTYHLAGQ